MVSPEPLSDRFFIRDVKLVAKDLLGKALCVRQKDGVIKKDIISETEAYDGEGDLACHASKGKTNRTSVMYERGGLCYVYLCYGMHWMLNFVTGPSEYPAAVLIRGTFDFNGPGRLTKGLNIRDVHNGIKLEKKSAIWIEDTGYVPKKIQRGSRIGIDYAGPIWSKKPYRFWFSKH